MILFNWLKCSKTFYNFDIHEGPKSGLRIECPQPEDGSSKVLEGPHRYHGHIMHKDGTERYDFC